MTGETSERATRFRGEGRPKRRLSPSPPPPKVPAVAKPPSAKKPPPKQKEPPSTASKKGTSAKKKARTPTPEEEEEEDALPVSLKDKKSLPILKVRQPEDLSLRTHKSIAESGILQVALDKSRQRWLTDGLFEKFWVKYSRKNKDEPAPSSQSMTKINGECFMIIEPHSFKVTLFSVKAPPTASSQTSTSNGASHSSTALNPPPMTSTPAITMPPVSEIKPVKQEPLPTPTKSVDSASEKTAASGNAATPETAAASDTAVASEEAAVTEKVAASSPQQPVKSAPEPTPVSNPPPRPEPSPNADPVIQMLAARAATDEELKTLMKIVANGKANQDQLTIFQRHIDELNGIIQAQKRQASGVASNTVPMLGQPYHTTTFNPPHTSQAPAHIQQSSMRQDPFTNFFNPTPTPPVKQKAALSSKPVLSAIVFEFAEASGTRYLLPKDSILEYLPGNTQVLMSFMITRKGDAAIGGKHGASREYYQPVTVRLMADNAKTLEPLTRVIAPPDDVRRRMSQQIGTLELAQDAYLALRLPRSTEEGQPADDASFVPKAEVLQARYDAPNSLLPISRPKA